jgi:hypothetical protein
MPLILGTQNSPRSADQLWKFVPLFGFPSLPTNGYIQSQMDPNLVVDVTGGGRETRGTRLETWTRNSPASGNQLWYLLPAPGNSYAPRITSIVPAGRGFSITGAGFQAITPVFANWAFLPSGAPALNDFGSFSAMTDFGGGFVSDSRIPNLDGNQGTLQVQIFISVPALPNDGRVLASWDGSKFTIQ